MPPISRLQGQEQVINDRLAHVTQVVRGKRELLRPGVHGGFKREHFCVVENVRCVLQGFLNRNAGVDAEQL